jgi:hypothetical protein
LGRHQIGYHSSGHTVHPTIIEFTDIPDYLEAYEASLQRETKHIDALTGNMEGRGGIHALQELFPRKRIEAFRAPGMCWSPPHLEALRSLDLIYDFSTRVSYKPVDYKGITFYPYPVVMQWQGSLKDYRRTSFSLLKNNLAVIDIHPSLMVNREDWDSIYHHSKGNPSKLTKPSPKSCSEIRHQFSKLGLLLKQIRRFQKMNLLEATPALKKSQTNLTITKNEVDKCYEWSALWAVEELEYQPRFLRDHFTRFFEVAVQQRQHEL